MLTAAFAQGFFKIALALIGIVSGRIALMWFDYWMKNSEFTRWLDEAEDNAKAIYYAGRFVGVSLVIGMAVG